MSNSFRKAVEKVGFLEQKNNKNNSSALLIFLGIFLFSGLVGSYVNFYQTVKKTHYEIFNFTDAVSWVKRDAGIERIDAKGTRDATLLSHDGWGDFQFNFSVTSPRDCGVIFDYQNNSNFRFIYFQKSLNRIALGQKKNGRLISTQVFPFDILQKMNCILELQKGRMKFSINRQAVVDAAVDRSMGRIGLFLNDAYVPKTVFGDLEISGRTAQGMVISAKNKQDRMGNLLRYLSALIPLNILMTIVAYCLAFLCLKFPKDLSARFERARAKIRSRHYPVILIHAVLTVFIFYPFIFRGQVLVSSSDNFGEIFPLFLFSKHNFWSILSGQSLCLWNPYAHNGVPFFNNHWNMIYDPLNWPVFLFDDQHILSVLTFRTMLEVFFIGIFAYKTFSIELASKKWALFCSVVYQLCSFLIFALSIFPVISLYLAMTLYLYVLWSMQKRSKVKNYLLLTFSVILILTSANVAFIFYAGLSLAVFTVYRLTSCPLKEGEGKGRFFLVGGSIVTAVLISAIRVVPCILGVLDSNRLVDNYYTIQDRVMMITRFFVPEIAGWIGPNSFNALLSKNLNLIFAQCDLPSNSQNSFFVYFGIIPALLLLLNVFIRAKVRHLFWKIYAFLTVAIALLYQPFWGILSILFFPLNHYSYHLILLPVGICMLIGYTGKMIEEEGCDFAAVGRRYTLALLLAQVFLLTILTYLFPVLTCATRFIFVGIIGGYVGYRYFRDRNSPARDILVAVVVFILETLLTGIIFFIGSSALIQSLPQKGNEGVWILIPALLILLIIFKALQNYIFVQRQKEFSAKPILWRAGPRIACEVTLIGIGFFFIDGFLAVPDGVRNYFIDVSFGHAKFWMLTGIGLSLFFLFRRKKISALAAVFFLIGLTTVDLIYFNARFDNVVAPTPLNRAFYPTSFAYRDLQPALKGKLDLLNYRCDNSHMAGLNGNKNMIFQTPSYTGIMGYMPQRFSDLVKNFGYAKETVLIRPEDSSQDERFLDLSSVKYTFQNESTVKERNSALARLMVFYSYQFIPERKQLLEFLKDPAFNPHEQILLSQEPRGAEVFDSRRNADFAPIRSATSDEIRAKISTVQSALVFFNESYSGGWKAYVDNKEVPVYTANYNAMACLVNPGLHDICFRFLPRSFLICSYVSFFGLFVFLGVTILLAWQNKASERRIRPA